MERRGILICAGYFYGIPFSLKKEDLIIAVDGGFRYCQEEGITPSLILGDLDSLAASFSEILLLYPIIFFRKIRRRGRNFFQSHLSRGFP